MTRRSAAFYAEGYADACEQRARDCRAQAAESARKLDVAATELLAEQAKLWRERALQARADAQAFASSDTNVRQSESGGRTC